MSEKLREMDLHVIEEGKSSELLPGGAVSAIARHSVHKKLGEGWIINLAPDSVLYSFRQPLCLMTHFCFRLASDTFLWGIMSIVNLDKRSQGDAPCPYTTQKV